MRLFIPTIGTVLTLSQDWNFNLFNESRNYNVIEGLNLSQKGLDAAVDAYYEYRKTHAGRDEECIRLYNIAYNWSWNVTLPIDSELKVDRIYIRKGQGGFDSVSFWLTSTPHPLLSKVKGKKRFWAKLDDVNNMEVKDIE